MIIHVIIIISLFQEDNIFGTSVSLAYGPQLQIYIWENLLTLRTEHDEVSVHRAYRERDTQPYSLRGVGTICLGLPHVVRDSN